jgi:tRNA A37 threonylcarbamoyladenosine dehydratase
MERIWTDRFGGIDRLYGRGALARFRDGRIAVVGLGGVGSWRPKRWRAPASGT